jgi:DNA adenine methylase
MKAPFPYFGGKSRVADIVWERFGHVRNYIEPFCGSMAMLLGRPNVRGAETVNDIDGLLTNFWRALKADPEGLAALSECPPSEIDCTARHNWVYENKQRIIQMQQDPEYYDLKAAAFWVYVRSTAVGTRGIFDEVRGSRVPYLKTGGYGIHSERSSDINAYFKQLSNRIRSVRICCGDWKRVLTKPPLRGAGSPAAIFLDPPYDDGGWDSGAYEHSGGVFKDVRQWAIEHGKDPTLRIALCGFHPNIMPEDWIEFAWEKDGGWGIENSSRERIWFSPHCLNSPQIKLF